MSGRRKVRAARGSSSALSASGSAQALELRGRELGGQGLRPGVGVAPGEQRVKVHGAGLLPGALRLRLCGGRDAPGHALLVAAYGERQRPAAGAEGRADEPLGHAPHGQQRLGRDVLLGRGRELVHGLLRVGHGAGDEEPLPRTGHGNVEEPQLLAQELALEPVRHGAAREGGVLYAPRGVRELRAQAQLRVHQHAAAQVRAVELPRRVADEHHRELKALRAVDAHYAHRAAAVLVGESGLLAALAHGAQPVEEAAQPAPARGLKAPRELEEAQQPARGGPPRHASRSRAPCSRGSRISPISSVASSESRAKSRNLSSVSRKARAFSLTSARALSAA